MAIRFEGMMLFLVLSLLLLEASVVFGDIGTATSYNPPYTRKSKQKIKKKLLVNILLLLVVDDLVYMIIDYACSYKMQR